MNILADYSTSMNKIYRDYN